MNKLLDIIHKEHKDLLVLIADPKDDMVAIYHNEQAVKFKDRDGSVRRLIAESKLTEKNFDKKIDQFLNRVKKKMGISFIDTYMLFGVLREFLFKAAKVGGDNKTDEEYAKKQIDEALKKRSEERSEEESGETNSEDTNEAEGDTNEEDSF